MTSRWPHLRVLGSAELPPLAGDQDKVLWPSLLDLAEHLPADHVVIGGVMVYLHGASAGRQPTRVTSDVDVLFDLGVVPGSLREAVAALATLGYRVDPSSPPNSSHRYVGRGGEMVDILAPAGMRPRPDLTTTPPGRTIEVHGGTAALANRVLVQATYGERTHEVVVPDLARAIAIKCAAYLNHARDRPAEAHNSRHLHDLAFLSSLVDDPDEVLDSLGETTLFTNITALDDANHPAWNAAGSMRADARLAWSVLRHP